MLSLPNQTPEEVKKEFRLALYLNNFCNKLCDRRWPHLIQGRWRTELSGCKWGEACRANSTSIIFPAWPSAQPSLFSSCHGTGRLHRGASGSHRGKEPLEVRVDGHALGHLAPLRTLTAEHWWNPCICLIPAAPGEGLNSRIEEGCRSIWVLNFVTRDSVTRQLPKSCSVHFLISYLTRGSTSLSLTIFCSSLQDDVINWVY